ncbi:hypothetical protein LshimejAT787_0204820 [Lyophyllum shimeji]|uniref:Uncharacterized protein n=1 Tax=Lyophyllum shimeji TaxID=47721 RepID=A0A9P3UJ08_LYOSH|nr:hypothetical protein LshimejAT787_0204820 [Lyophyllum shimeji]
MQNEEQGQESASDKLCLQYDTGHYAHAMLKECPIKWLSVPSEKSHLAASGKTVPGPMAQTCRRDSVWVPVPTPCTASRTPSQSHNETPSI